MGDGAGSEATRGKRATLVHLPALDGLRGLAVLGVLLFHADGLLVGGYLGVDLFFVLSGFLITSLLLLEHESTGRIDLAAFWVRRARRLFPALLALMPAVALYARLYTAPKDVAALRLDAFAALAYVANWRSIFANKSYWDLFAAPSPLEHTWSLAIEEQFYVLWPLVVVLIHQVTGRGRRGVFVVSAVLASASALWMAALFDPARSSRAYLGTDTRGAAILLGAAMSCARLAPPKTPRGARALDGAGALALVGLAWAWLRLDGQSPHLYRGGFFLTELAALVLIACASAGAASVVARALAARPLRFFGTISYGLYLWHWPIFVWLDPARTHLHGAALTALRFAATLAVTLASYYALEQPIRRRGVFFASPWLVVPASVVAAVLAIVWGTRAKAEPVAEFVIEGASRAPRVVSLRDLPPKSELPAGTMRVLVVGDSVAEALGERMRAVQASARAAVADRGIGDCSIMEGIRPTRSLTNEPHKGGNCAAAWEADVRALDPDVTLVVLGGGFFAPVELSGRWQRPCEPGWVEAYRDAVATKLAALAPRTRVVVARVPYPVGSWDSPPLHGRVDCFNRTLDAAAMKVPASVTLDLFAFLCPEGACALTSDGAPIRPDGMHFQGEGANATARWVLAELRRIAGASSPR